MCHRQARWYWRAEQQPAVRTAPGRCRRVAGSSQGRARSRQRNRERPLAASWPLRAHARAVASGGAPTAPECGNDPGGPVWRISHRTSPAGRGDLSHHPVVWRPLKVGQPGEFGRRREARLPVGLQDVLGGSEHRAEGRHTGAGGAVRAQGQSDRASQGRSRGLRPHESSRRGRGRTRLQRRTTSGRSCQATTTGVIPGVAGEPRPMIPGWP